MVSPCDSSRALRFARARPAHLLYDTTSAGIAFRISSMRPISDTGTCTENWSQSRTVSHVWLTWSWITTGMHPATIAFRKPPLHPSPGNTPQNTEVAMSDPYFSPREPGCVRFGGREGGKGLSTSRRGKTASRARRSPCPTRACPWEARLPAGDRGGEEGMLPIGPTALLEGPRAGASGALLAPRR